MNFENQTITFKPKPLFEDVELQKRLLLKKQELVDKYRPKESTFTDIYPESEIKADLEEIEKIKSSFDKGDESNEYLKNISSIYEGVIADQIGANAWFGDNCESIATSEYDDIKNGVDVVTIFKEDQDKHYLGLGVDVTFASDKKVLEKKLESIKQCIRTMSLPSLKYFQDPETEEHKKIFLPKVIIGSRLSSAEKLIQLWGSKDVDKNKKLAEHPVSSKIIMESLAQLKYFYDYAMHLSDNDPIHHNKDEYRKIAIGYGKMYNIFVDIYQAKKDTINTNLNEISDDIVYETICEYTNKT
ncbi:MAG TPA: hypothetical protein VK153_02295 [Candidatus Paceibacterota bacterium]|nr:hypothetical protein [Candidatus Paceibacterota bacterium]